MRIIFTKGLSRDEKSRYVGLIKETSRIKRSSNKARYNLVSKSAAINSRQRLANISNEEAILLRIYGRLGLIINKTTRRVYSSSPGMSEPPVDVANMLVRDFKSGFNIREPRDVAKATTRQHGELNSRAALFIANATDHTIALTRSVDDVIERYRDQYSESDYLYRIYRSRLGAYNGDSSSPDFNEKAIRPGNVLVDEALTSASFDLEAVIYRYSGAGQAATFGRNPREPESHEEILFVIERNEHLAALNISGLKAKPKSEGKDQDELSSGEYLIRSRTPFRVLAVQYPDPGSNRRIVILRPLALSEVDFTRDAIRSPFNGQDNRPILESRLMRESSEASSAAARVDQPRRPDIMLPKPPKPEETQPNPSGQALEDLLNPALEGAIGGASPLITQQQEQQQNGQQHG